VSHRKKTPIFAANNLTYKVLTACYVKAISLETQNEDGNGKMVITEVYLNNNVGF